jgi:hypothetical protein
MVFTPVKLTETVSPKSQVSNAPLNPTHSELNLGKTTGEHSDSLELCFKTRTNILSSTTELKVNATPPPVDLDFPSGQPTLHFSRSPSQGLKINTTTNYSIGTSRGTTLKRNSSSDLEMSETDINPRLRKVPNNRGVSTEKPLQELTSKKKTGGSAGSNPTTEKKTKKGYRKKNFDLFQIANTTGSSFLLSTNFPRRLNTESRPNELKLVTASNVMLQARPFVHPTRFMYRAVGTLKHRFLSKASPSVSQHMFSVFPSAGPRSVFLKHAVRGNYVPNRALVLGKSTTVLLVKAVDSAVGVYVRNASTYWKWEPAAPHNTGTNSVSFVAMAEGDEMTFGDPESTDRVFDAKGFEVWVRESITDPTTLNRVPQTPLANARPTLQIVTEGASDRTNLIPPIMLTVRARLAYVSDTTCPNVLSTPPKCISHGHAFGVSFEPWGGNITSSPAMRAGALRLLNPVLPNTTTTPEKNRPGLETAAISHTNKTERCAAPESHTLPKVFAEERSTTQNKETISQPEEGANKYTTSTRDTPETPIPAQDQNTRHLQFLSSAATLHSVLMDTARTALCKHKGWEIPRVGDYSRLYSLDTKLSHLLLLPGLQGDKMRNALQTKLTCDIQAKIASQSM